MKIKKLASLLIACAMVVGMAMPAFAGGFNFGDDQQQNDQQQNDQQQNNDQQQQNDQQQNNNASPTRSLNFSGTTQVPTVNVSVSTSAAIVLNPYGLKYGTDDVTDPFISDTVYVTNQSDCAVAISGSFTPTVSGDAKLVDSAAKADTGLNNKLVDKNVYVQVLVGEVASNDTKIEFESDSTLGLTGTPTYRDRIKKATAKTSFKNFKSGAKTGLYALKTANAVNFGDTNDANTTKLPYVLGAGDETATVLGIRMFGLCEKWVSSPWTANDKVSVAMALSILPTNPD